MSLANKAVKENMLAAPDHVNQLIIPLVIKKKTIVTTVTTVTHMALTNSINIWQNHSSSETQTNKIDNQSLTEESDNPSEIDLKRMHKNKPLSFREFRRAIKMKKKVF